MAGRITYSVLGTVALVLALLFAADPPKESPALGGTFGLVGIGFMLAAGAYSLGEVAASRRVMLAPAPPVQPQPGAPPAPAAPYPAPSYPAPASGQPYPGQSYSDQSYGGSSYGSYQS